jgi:high-affinity nickel permease
LTLQRAHLQFDLRTVSVRSRHATDPDHIAAVTTLMASSREPARRRAAALGMWWGLGHALTLVLFGVPILLFEAYLPVSSSAARRRPSPR